jgi:hypothetical protein
VVNPIEIAIGIAIGIDTTVIGYDFDPDFDSDLDKQAQLRQSSGAGDRSAVLVGASVEGWPVPRVSEKFFSAFKRSDLNHRLPCSSASGWRSR